MDDMKFKADESVRFYFEGRECTGIVEQTQSLPGFVLLRSNDSGHSWATLQAVRESVVWRPGEEPPKAAVALLEARHPAEGVPVEATPS